MFATSRRMFIQINEQIEKTSNSSRKSLLIVHCGREREKFLFFKLFLLIHRAEGTRGAPAEAQEPRRRQGNRRPADQHPREPGPMRGQKSPPPQNHDCTITEPPLNHHSTTTARPPPEHKSKEKNITNGHEYYQCLY